MLVQRDYAIESMEEMRRILQRYGWALLVVAGQEGLEATHVPCLLDPDQDEGVDAPELVVLGHTARADPISIQLDRGREVLLIFQGPNGYVSPDWYGTGTFVPTWNFTAVHVHGVPEVLEGDEGFAVLERTVEHFEAARDQPWRLGDEAMTYARRIASGTVPFRLRAARIEAKAKLGQDKSEEIQDRVIAALDQPGPYRNPPLAEEMRRVAGKRQPQ